MKRTLLLLFILVCSATSVNYWDRHGNNYFVSKDTRYFPIIWDVRGVRHTLSAYHRNYSNNGIQGYADLQTILAEAFAAGVNSASLRIRFDPLDPYAFEDAAAIVEEESLLLFAGGFKTDISEEATAYNTTIINYLESFQETHSDYFIGVIAFDEPDNLFGHTGDPAWYDLVINTCNQVKNVLNIPFSSLLCVTWDLDILGDFCSMLEFPLYNIYPCRINDFNDYYLGSTQTRICATDIASDGPDAISTYCTQDELILINDTYIQIWRYENEFIPDGLEMVQVGGDITIPTSAPIRYASSDFRAMDLNSDNERERNINGAVVVWGEDPRNNIVVYNNTGEITSASIPIHDSLTRIVECCVGEINYPVVYPEPTDREGLIGHGDMRILLCYESSAGTGTALGVRIFAKKAPSGFENVTNNEGSLFIRLPEYFEPTGCVWGAFWNHGNVAPTSGFILYDDIGRYVVIYQDEADPEEKWTRSDELTDLFPRGVQLPGDEDLIFISRLNMSPNGGHHPAYIAGRDFLCMVADGYHDYLYWKSGLGDDPSVGLQIDPGSTVIQNSTSSAHIVSAGTDRAGEWWSIYADRLVLVLDDNTVHVSEDPLFFEGIGAQLQTEVVKSGSGDMQFLTAARVFQSKLPHRSAVIWRSDGPCFQLSAELSGENNMSSYIDRYETIWNTGIAGSTRCLIPNVQAYGRHGQRTAAYCPSIEELRYMTVSPIIRGARGVQYYALDLAMVSGNGEIGSGSFTCPAELVNWGPSSDTENSNMIYRVHQVTSELNGVTNCVQNYYADALVGELCYAMNESEVEHAVANIAHLKPILDNQCGFLAIKDTSTGNIYVLLANDSQLPSSGKALWFRNEISEDWELYNTSGHEVTILTSIQMGNGVSSEVTDEPRIIQSNLYSSDCISESTRYDLPLVIDYSGLPSYGVSLFTLVPAGCDGPIEQDFRSSETVLSLETISGSVSIECEFGITYSSASIDVYDLSGRLTKHVWSDLGGNSESIRTSFTTNDLPAGLYFVGLQVDDHIISEKFIVY